MAKRRILKKEIGYVAGDLFSEVLVCKLFVPGVEKGKADALFSRILDMQDEFVRRAGSPDAKDNKKLVKEYYKKLRADLQAEEDAIVSEIDKLSKESGK